MSGKIKSKDVEANIATYFEMKRAMVKSSATRIKETPSSICKIDYLYYIIIKMLRRINDECTMNPKASH